jgi:hypothetical protein
MESAAHVQGAVQGALYERSGAHGALRPRFRPGACLDIDLLGGYKDEWVPVRKGACQETFWGLRLEPGFAGILRNLGARVLWLQGWQVADYWQAAAPERLVAMEIWMRGDSNMRSNSGGLNRVALRLLRKRIDRFLCVGEANGQFDLHQGICEEQLASAPHCVDNSRFAAHADALHPEREVLRKRWGIPAGVFCVLLCAKLVKKKRPLDLIEAVKRLNGTAGGKAVHVLIAGTGEFEGALRDAASGQSVTFAGFLNQSGTSKNGILRGELASSGNL